MGHNDCKDVVNAGVQGSRHDPRRDPFLKRLLLLIKMRGSLYIPQEMNGWGEKAREC